MLKNNPIPRIKPESTMTPSKQNTLASERQGPGQKGHGGRASDPLNGWPEQREAFRGGQETGLWVRVSRGGIPRGGSTSAKL